MSARKPGSDVRYRNRGKNQTSDFHQKKIAKAKRKSKKTNHRHGSVSKKLPDPTYDYVITRNGEITIDEFMEQHWGCICGNDFWVDEETGIWHMNEYCSRCGTTEMDKYDSFEAFIKK